MPKKKDDYEFVDFLSKKNLDIAIKNATAYESRGEVALRMEWAKEWGVHAQDRCVLVLNPKPCKITKRALLYRLAETCVTAVVYFELWRREREGHTVTQKILNDKYKALGEWEDWAKEEKEKQDAQRKELGIASINERHMRLDIDKQDDKILLLETQLRAANAIATVRGTQIRALETMAVKYHTESDVSDPDRIANDMQASFSAEMQMYLKASRLHEEQEQARHTKEDVE